MTAILKEELPRTEAAHETALRDSRLGYEWEQDYIYTPDHVREKINLLRATSKNRFRRIGGGTDYKVFQAVGLDTRSRETIDFGACLDENC